MKKTTLAYKAEKMGYKVLFSSVIGNEGVEETKTEILKDGVKILTVASDARWVMNNDTEGFVKLSEDDQDDLMLIVLEFLATHKRDR